MDPDYAHIRYEWNQRCLDGRQRLLTVDLEARSGKRIEERIWWMFLIYWAIWTLIRQNYFRMLSAGTSQDVGLPPCPNLPAPMLARVRWIYMQNIQMCIPWTHLCSTKKKQQKKTAWTHAVHTLIETLWYIQPFFTVCYFVLSKKAVISDPVFCLARRCSLGRCCVFFQTSMHILVYTCVYERKREREVFEKACIYI